MIHRRIGWIHITNRFYVVTSSLGCQVRYAHFTTQAPRQKIATQLFGFAHPPPYSEQENRIDKKRNIENYDRKGQRP